MAISRNRGLHAIFSLSKCVSIIFSMCTDRNEAFGEIEQDAYDNLVHRIYMQCEPHNNARGLTNNSGGTAHYHIGAGL